MRTRCRITGGPITRGAAPLGGALLSGVVLLGAAGCQHQALAERRLGYRADALHWTAETLARSEQMHWEDLGDGLAYIPENEQRHAEWLAQSAEGAAQMLRDDVERWQQRQPLYWKEFGRILRGRPEEIEPNAIVMFY
jgi:hypothetical protein